MEKRKSLAITFVKTPAAIPAAIADLKARAARYPFNESQIEISESVLNNGYYIEIWLLPAPNARPIQ